MWNWIKRLFGFSPQHPGWTDDDNDPVMQEVLRRCWQSGNAVIANQNDDGTVSIEEISSSGFVTSCDENQIVDCKTVGTPPTPASG